MRLFALLAGQLLLWSGILAAQTSAVPAPPLPVEMGKWWKNSEIISKLQLSESQAIQIEQSFLEHRSHLASLNTELKRHEAELRRLMQEDRMDETAIQAQTENVATSRAALEKANSAMMLSIRKVLTSGQWTQLEEMRHSNIYTPGTDGVKFPRAIRRPMPAYTDAAKQAKIEGVILLQVTIRKDGTVDSIKVLRGLGYGLDESAMQTIEKEWQFEPGTKNGKPVDVQANIEVSFRLY